MYPAVKQHLLSFGFNRLKQTGEPGARKKTNNKWFETQDSINYWEDFSRQKIAWGNLNLKASYAIVDKDIFLNAPCPMIVPANKYLLAILNSKLADFFIRGLGVTRNGGYFEYKPMFVEKLPVPIISESEQFQFEKLIDSMGNDSALNNLIASQIDELVYKLYDLTEEEADCIETAKTFDLLM